MISQFTPLRKLIQLSRAWGVGAVPNSAPNSAPDSVPLASDDGLPQPQDATATHPRYKRWRGVLPLPNPRLMLSIGAANVENFYVVADAWAQTISQIIRPNSTVLDIGCGCGRTARLLVSNPSVEQYVGFDVIKPSIDWCSRYFSPLYGNRFRFVHFDLYSKNYNPTGTIKPHEFTFPLDDNSVSFTFAASLFTHVLEQDAKHYLSEISRVLKAGGLFLASIHTAPQVGERYSGDEYRIDVEPAYFIQLASDAGLTLHQQIGELCGQEALVFEKWK